MHECPECGGELVLESSHTESEGTHEVYECNSCGRVYEIEEIQQP